MENLAFADNPISKDWNTQRISFYYFYLANFKYLMFTHLQTSFIFIFSFFNFFNFGHSPVAQ